MPDAAAIRVEVNPVPSACEDGSTIGPAPSASQRSLTRNHWAALTALRPLKDFVVPVNQFDTDGVASLQCRASPAWEISSPGVAIESRYDIAARIRSWSVLM